MQADIVQEQNTNINSGIQAIYCAEYKKNPPHSAAIKFAEVSHYNKGSNNGTKWQDKGEFHINLQLPPSHIRQPQFQQGIIQEIIQQFGPTQIVLFELPGEISLPEQHVLAIKQSIKELWHLTYFTDFIIVHGVQHSQCCNLQGCWILATFAINTAIPRESCED